MRRTTVTISLSLLLAGAVLAQDAPLQRVHVRITNPEGHVVPAMVCITGVQDELPRLPPAGTVTTRPSNVEDFVRGIEYRGGATWVGPVRKMIASKQGPSDNEVRALVYEVRPSIPYWREPVMYQVSGEFDIDLPNGHWRLAVDRGLEHVPVFREFRTGPDGPQKIEITMRRWIELGAEGWWSGDIHVHHPLLTPAHRDYLLSYAQACDLHIVNVLEMGHHGGTHFPQEGFGPAFRQRRGNHVLVSGQEDPRSTFGHIIGLNLKKMARDVSRYDFYDVTFKGIQEQPGALVGYAHFAWNGCDLPRGFPWYVTTGDLDFVELLQFGQVNAADYYDYLNLGFRLAAAAGSDIPWGSTLGEVRTYVYTRPGELDVDAWFAALKQGRSFVTNGPVLELEVDGQRPGAEIKAARGDRLKVTVRARTHQAVSELDRVTIVNSDGIVKEIARSTGMPAPSADGPQAVTLEADIPVERSGWITASAVGTNGALAHTSPVYVVVDGRPTWSPRLGPAIIERQLAAIGRMEQEFAGPNDDRAKGVRERLARARAFYDDLRQQMSAAVR